MGRVAETQWTACGRDAMTHDPLCALSKAECLSSQDARHSIVTNTTWCDACQSDCQCDLIAKVIIREASLAVIGAAGHLVEQRANQFSLDEVCARLGIDAQRVRDLVDERGRIEQEDGFI